MEVQEHGRYVFDHACGCKNMVDTSLAMRGGCKNMVDTSLTMRGGCKNMVDMSLAMRGGCKNMVDTSLTMRGGAPNNRLSRSMHQTIGAVLGSCWTRLLL